MFVLLYVCLIRRHIIYLDTEIKECSGSRQEFVGCWGVMMTSLFSYELHLFLWGFTAWRACPLLQELYKRISSIYRRGRYLWENAPQRAIALSWSRSSKGIGPHSLMRIRPQLALHWHLWLFLGSPTGPSLYDTGPTPFLVGASPGTAMRQRCCCPVQLRVSRRESRKKGETVKKRENNRASSVGCIWD